MRSTPLVARLALFALTVGTSSEAGEIKRSAGQPLATILERALADGREPIDSSFARCEESFKYYLDTAAQAIADGRDKSAGVTADLLWVVGEGGGMSTTTVIQASQSGTTKVIFKEGDLTETTLLTAEETKKMNVAWRALMTGKIREINDIADGSCTLAFDGRRARLLLPRHGVPSEMGDALQAVVSIIDASEHR